MTVPEIQHVTYQPGSLLLVRSANVVALVDDSQSPPDALNALIGAATLGDHASLTALASGETSKFSSLAMLIKGDTGWRSLLYGQLGCQVESASSVTITNAKPGQLHAEDIAETTVAALRPLGADASSPSTGIGLTAGAVRASSALVNFNGTELADRDVSSVVVESPAVQVAALTPSVPDPEPVADAPIAEHSDAPKTARIVLPTADTQAPPPAPPAPEPVAAEEVAAETPDPEPVVVEPQTPAAQERSLPPVGPGVASVSEGTSTLFRPPQQDAPTSAPTSTPAAPQPPSSSAPAPPSWANGSDNVVDLDAPGVPARPALAVEGGSATAEPAVDREVVQVLGVRCPADHHNHPNAVYCAQCGRRMGVNQTAVAQPGPRPPLGLFLLGDGSSFSIASDMVIGRDPSGHVDVTDHGADVLRLSDDRAEISRAHVGIYLDNWSVTAIDLNSANGTEFKPHDGDDWMPLGTESRSVLQAGDTLRVGNHELRLELHHVQG